MTMAGKIRHIGAAKKLKNSLLNVRTTGKAEKNAVITALFRAHGAELQFFGRAVLSPKISVPAIPGPVLPRR